MTEIFKYPSANVSALPVLLSNVKSSFNTSAVSAASATLYDLRRGGSIVPDIANAYGSVSTTNPRLASFANLTYPPVNLRDPVLGFSLSDLSIQPDECWAEIACNSVFGSNIRVTQGITVTNTAWLFEGNRADYDIRLTKVSGSPSGMGGSAVNTWINMALSPTWYWQTDGIGYDIVTFTGWLELRMNASPNHIFANNSVTVTLEQEI